MVCLYWPFLYFFVFHGIFSTTFTVNILLNEGMIVHAQRVLFVSLHVFYCFPDLMNVTFEFSCPWWLWNIAGLTLLTMDRYCDFLTFCCGFEHRSCGVGFTSYF
jgi:hypothetical protein